MLLINWQPGLLLLNPARFPVSRQFPGKWEITFQAILVWKQTYCFLSFQKENKKKNGALNSSIFPPSKQFNVVGQVGPLDLPFQTLYLSFHLSAHSQSYTYVHLHVPRTCFLLVIFKSVTSFPVDKVSPLCDKGRPLCDNCLSFFILTFLNIYIIIFIFYLSIYINKIILTYFC